VEEKFIEMFVDIVGQYDRSLHIFLGVCLEIEFDHKNL